MAQDYYKTLGVDRSADEKTIKQAFRKLAKQYHPDANPDNPNAEARFKEINEAYEVLSDPEKRAQYDQFGSVGNVNGFPGWGQRGGTYTYTSSDEVPFDFGEMLNSMFGGRAQPGGGRGQQPGARVRVTQGQDIEQTVRVSLREAYEGTSRLVTRGSERKKVSIPAGAKTGTRVRLSGQGEAGFGGGASGDLYLIVEVEPDPQFTRDGDNLTTEVKVDLFTAMLGGEIEVPTLGRPVKLKIPAGTQSGRKFRLAGKGMPILNSESSGDLFARVLITVPENLTPAQREAVEKLRSMF
jgi:curved DNA-binding protein